MVEQDVIGHLIDVERLAHDLLLEAETEADRRKKAARENAEKAYRAAAESIMQSMDASFAEACLACDERQKREFDVFNERLESIKKDRTAFNACLETIFLR